MKYRGIFHDIKLDNNFFDVTVKNEHWKQKQTNGTKSNLKLSVHF